MKESRGYQTAQTELFFNKFIRIRDYGEPCISCQRYFSICEMDAGHYRSKGAAPELRFDEDNVNLQCRDCNSGFLSGNRENYRKNLIKKIGIERVERLEKYQGPSKLTIDDLFNLRKKYQEKCDELLSDW
ncbi:recombination protein NinG [Photobacterium damselae subsp. damselae]|uniref:recombination protein NinG n=1 Tax=Photobacterium damselae TaxID=38293 RepID=UPI001F168543|nr:recombination protein NinG [Photobacterium damselae]UKA23364.1 recombination protein NinG [Photobacterium damselae subsp. damselae]